MKWHVRDGVGSWCWRCFERLVGRLGWGSEICGVGTEWSLGEFADLRSEGFSEELSSKNECSPTNKAPRASEGIGEDSCVRRNSGRYENEVRLSPW